MARQNSWFWDFIAKKYARDPVSDQASYEKKLKTTRQYMHEDMNVAEIGCGTGSTAIAHSPYVKHIFASDLSEKMLMIAKGKVADQNIENISFDQATAEDFGAAEGPFDMVMAHSILHLLDDKDIVIKSIFRKLKPGGIFVSSTVCIGAQGIVKFMLPVGNFLGILPLVRFITPEEMLQSMAKAGFEIEQHWQPRKNAAIFIVAKKP